LPNSAKTDRSDPQSLKHCFPRIDIGTSDEMAIDILLNVLIGFSTDISGIKTIYVGGENEDWPKRGGEKDRNLEGAEDEDEEEDDGQEFEDESAPRYPKVRARRQIYRVKIGI
jgi:hypothetical protein